MTPFRVHYSLDGESCSSVVTAKTPDAAREEIANRHKGQPLAFGKVKVDRSPSPDAQDGRA